MGGGDGGDDENGWLDWLALIDQKTPTIMNSGSNNYPKMANVTGEQAVLVQDGMRSSRGLLWNP